MLKERLKQFYVKHYKHFLIFTIVLIAFSIGLLLFTKISTGSFIKKGASLTGGTSLRASVIPGFDVSGFETHLEATFPGADFTIREITSDGQLSNIIVETADLEDDVLLATFTEYQGSEPEEFSAQEFGATISSAFFRQIVAATIIALILMGIVVFITFRDIIPSLFVILAAVSTIITTLAFTVLLNIKLSSAGIAAFLMLIGYSVDTDILLTTRVLKRQEGGSLQKKIFDSMRTGLTLTITSLSAVFVAYLFTNSEVIGQITLILSIGLFFDMIYTWLQNAVILRIHMEKRHRGRSE